MKKIYYILMLIFGFILILGLVYATVTIANNNKSSYVPWQGTPVGYYDNAHNVGTSNIAESRFSFTSGAVAGGISVVLDSITGLSWQSEGVTQGTKTWVDADTYCTNLALGGEIDWKLPNIKQLQSIVDYTKINPSIDNNYFIISNSSYWSSTITKYNTSNAWKVDYISGLINNNNKTNTYNVRCVR